MLFAIIVMFHALVAFIAYGIIFLKRWWILLGLMLLVLDAYSFEFFLEALKR